MGNKWYVVFRDQNFQVKTGYCCAIVFDTKEEAVAFVMKVTVFGAPDTVWDRGFTVNRIVTTGNIHKYESVDIYAYKKALEIQLENGERWRFVHDF